MERGSTRISLIRTKQHNYEYEDEGEGGGGVLGVYSRPTVPRPGTIGDSQFCDRPTTVPKRPKRPNGAKVQRSNVQI